MTESDKALLQHGRITASATYAKLLSIESDPNKSIIIRDITIEFSSVADTPQIRVIINGQPYMRNFQPVVAQTKLSFGGDLVFHGKTQKPPILVEARDLTGTPNVTCVCTGIAKDYTPSKE